MHNDANILVNSSFKNNSGEELSAINRDKAISIKFSTDTEQVKKYFRKIAEIFTFNQYQQNKANSYLINENDIQGETIGFEHSDKEIICKVVANYTDLEIIISCGDNISDPYNQQIDILKDLNLSSGGIYIQNMIGDYAIIHYSTKGYVTGNSNIIAKIEGKWTPIVTSLQDSPACSVVEKYEVPTELYSNCH